MEAEVKDAVNSGSYYDDERPLNVLYTGGKFAGFLYEGDGSLTQEPQDDMSYESGYEGASVPSNRLSPGVNLAGTVVWTVFVMILMTLVMGAVAFIMKYIVIIVLIIGAYIWIKSKFSRRR